MQRMMWVQKRFWFAVLILGLIFIGHWFETANAPQRSAKAADTESTRELPAIGDVTPGSASESRRDGAELELESADAASSTPRDNR